MSCCPAAILAGCTEAAPLEPASFSRGENALDSDGLPPLGEDEDDPVMPLPPIEIEGPVHPEPPIDEDELALALPPIEDGDQPAEDRQNSR